MTKRIITNPKFIVERDGDNWVLKFRDGNIYKPIEFNNAQFSGKKNVVISQPNFSIIDDKLYVNINGHDVKIGEVGDGYTLASKLTHNTIVEPNLDVVITSNGGASIVTEIGGKNITINGGGNEPVIPTDRILYTVYTDDIPDDFNGLQSWWIDDNTDTERNTYDKNTGSGELILKEGVTEISGYDDDGWRSAFDGYEYDIESIVLPTQIISIGSGAFYYMGRLTSIVIPDSVETVGEYVVEGCYGLVEPVYNANCFVYFPYDYATEYTIPDGVRQICDSAFRNCNDLTSITIPNSVISIGNSAFDGCSSLSSINIPNSVTEIGYSTFNACSDLASVTIGNSVANIGDSAFSYCENLISINIPDSVMEIGGSAFDGCSSLSSINIPDSVTKIGESAFYQCSNLLSVTIGNSVASIGDSAFNRCGELASIVVNNGNNIYDSRNNCNAIIETATNTILVGCKNTIIPNSVTKIGHSAFYGCGTTSINIPDSVMEIGDGAFSYCENLISINIPDSVTKIGGSAFDGCSGLTSATIGNSANEIKGNTFSECIGLTSVIIGNSVTSIGVAAFNRCTSLVSITIGNSVNRIYDYAFNGCSSLIEVTCYAMTPPDLGFGDFTKATNDTLYVPSESVQAYLDNTKWNTAFNGNIQAIQE